MTKHFGYMNYWAVSAWVGLVAIIFVLVPDTASAQTTFRSIVDIPGISSDAGVTENFGAYINALYIFAITVGAMLAVLKLIAAGVKYMFSDIVTNKEAAKNDIKGALLGLLIVIGAVVILNTVNTDLTEADLNLAPANTDTTNYLELALARIRSLVDGCTGPECEVKDCEFWRVQLSCESWCRDQGPNTTYIHRGGLSYAGGGQITHQCIVRYEGNELEKRICEAAGNGWDSEDNICYQRLTGTSCPEGQEFTVVITDTGSMNTCVAPTTPSPQPIEGTEQIIFNYQCLNLCDQPGPSTTWNKSGAEIQCDALNGQLEDNPTSISQGICTYIPET